MGILIFCETVLTFKVFSRIALILGITMTSNSKRRNIFASVMCLYFALNSNFAAATPTEIAQTATLNHIMTDIGKVMIKIYPLIVVQRELKDDEIQNISQSLHQLSELFDAAKPFINMKSDGYQISLEFILDYLKVVKGIMASEHIDYTRSHLYALGEICSSCHTQDDTLRSLFSGAKRKFFSTDFAYAEFNFITRNYQDSIKYYQRFLDSSKSKSELEIIQPAQRVLAIFVQIRGNPLEGIQFLKKYYSLKEHTPETKNQFDSWISQLHALHSNGSEKYTNINFPTLESYIKKYLGDLDKVSYINPTKPNTELARVWLRGRLYAYLNKQPDEREIPKLLYWLSVIDRSLAYNYYFSLSDLYLKQCILKYAKSHYAKRCLIEYRTSIKHNYPHQVPEGIRLELNMLENALR